MADGAALSGKRRPRIAFPGEEFGFGYKAIDAFATRCAQSGVRTLADAGVSAVRKIDNSGFDAAAPERRPLYTKEQSLLAVKTGQADLAIVPFYSPELGYDRETLRALSSQFTLIGVEQIEATDRLCLAVYEPQMLDVVQSSHPGSGLSSLLREKRHSWHTNASRRYGAGTEPGGDAGAQYAAGFTPNASTQYMLRERVDMVFVGAEAAARCKAKLDSLRSAGVAIQQTATSVEPHREMARLARGTLNAARQTSTVFDPANGAISFMSAMPAEGAPPKLYGVIMPFEVAMRSHDYVIVDDEIEDADPDLNPAAKTRFLLVRSIVDETLIDDAKILRSERTKNWSKRLKAVLDDSAARHGDEGGVRVLMRISRGGAAASIGDVEDTLRHLGVRYQTERMDDDTGRSSPSPILLDMEFEPRDFRRGAVREVLSAAFTRTKGRSVLVLAAMPYAKPQLAARQPRRWWLEAPRDALHAFVEAMTEQHRMKIAAGVGAVATGAGAVYWERLAPIWETIRGLTGL